ncbi:hypothetical protein ACFQAT_20600 [Undibacterium arcticum]|uniref:Uncharacterized protein n=1 Tax=Undibacterium arcticum TaxID=1762892 RepID=A0ABV7EZ79_9BURK
MAVRASPIQCHNLRSEIIEFLIDTLGVDPQRVIGLARKLTGSLETPPDAVKVPKLVPAKRKIRTRPAA